MPNHQQALQIARDTPSSVTYWNPIETTRSNIVFNAAQQTINQQPLSAGTQDRNGLVSKPPKALNAKSSQGDKQSTCGPKGYKIQEFKLDDCRVETEDDSDSIASEGGTQPNRDCTQKHESNRYKQ